MAKLYFYYSSMNAGKTTNLLQSSHNYHERGMDTLLFKPKIDDRYEKDTITSRIGLHEKAVPCDEAFDFFAYTSEAIAKNSNIRCVLVDEIHMFKKQHIEQLSLITIELNIPVLAYGLRADFRGEVFESSKYLLAWAEELVELKTICHCGRKATMVLRIDKNGNPVRAGKQIEIGGNDRYVSVCRRHFLRGEPFAEKM